MVLWMKPLLMWRTIAINAALVVGLFILLAVASPGQLDVAFALSAFLFIILAPIAALAISRRLVFRNGIISDKTAFFTAWRSPVIDLALYPSSVSLLNGAMLRWNLTTYDAYDRPSDRQLGYFATGVFEPAKLAAFLKAAGYAPRGEEQRFGD